MNERNRRVKKAEKPFIVKDLAKRLSDAKSMVALDYQGLTVKDSQKLRQDIQSVGGNLLVIKNTLLKIALSQTNKDQIEKVEDQLEGPTAVVFAEEDEVAPLQKLGKFISAQGLPKLKFGIFGQNVFDAHRLMTLSKLPGKNILAGQVIGTLMSPSYGLVGTLSGNLQKLSLVLQARAKSLSQ